MNRPDDSSNIEDNLKILNQLEKSPHVTQRELVTRTEMSLGKINFLIRALIEKGVIKINRFKNSKNKLAYSYMLTPKGIKQKTEIAQLFLQAKIKEYNKLKRQIEEIQSSQIT